MKKSELRTQIRKIVREEVAMAIQEVITEMKEPVIEEQPEQPKRKKVVKDKQHFSSNSVLNDVLNETASDDEWKTMGGEPFSTANMSNVLQSQYGDVMNRGKISGNQMVASMGIDPNSVAPEVIDNIFNKDYSKLLKKMDEKSKQTRGI